MTRTITPIQILLLGFIVLILFGTLLLWLPVSARAPQETTFIDALFTVTSAVSTTGLVVVDTGTHYSTFGQIVILLLFQIGGLGYMTFITLVSLGIGARFTMAERLLLTESIAKPTSVEIRKFVKAVIAFTMVFELIGSALLTMVFVQRMPLADAIYSAVFHSVSAFCTAGFSLYADSFTAYADNGAANAIIALITMAGGIGFFVLYDMASFSRRLFRRDHPYRLSDHSKLALILSGALMASGTIALFLIEGSTKQPPSFIDRLLTASFQALSASTTTGFNTVDIGSMHPLSLVYIIILMFIGASPGGTGGGIKTTTFGIILLFIRSVLTNHEDVSAFRRTIPTSTVNRALGIGLLAALYLAVVVIALSVSEESSLLSIVFEATSALGTVGLSTGVTPTLSGTGKMLIIITMLIGRVGPLAIGYSLVGRFEPKRYAYPTGNVMVG
jgi:trk system potassium uptake protein TrkH